MSLTLRQICLVAAELKPVLEDLVAILGVDVCYVDPHVEIFEVENSLLPVGTNFIEVVAPVRDNTAAGRYLERRGGDGGYMIIAQAGSAEYQKTCRRRADKMGIRVAWEAAHDTGNYMQFHPADTGGSFFELDWDDNNDHQGNWPPAGGTGWESFVNTDIVRTIKAAELQSPDPDTLAKRWSAITDIPIQRNAAGQPELQLNNAAIRFADATDGRGEGLSAIDIEVIDAQQMLQVAQKRGLRTSDAQVIICGTRFNLI
ncbi:MAG: hypothetical protein PVG87_18195 [Desulfobacteraceae bacterium]|jgi:hypothetical protein